MKKVYTNLTALVFILFGLMSATTFAAATVTFNPTFPCDFGNVTTTTTLKITVTISGYSRDNPLVLTSSNPAFTLSFNNGEDFRSSINITKGSDIYVRFNPATVNGTVTGKLTLTEGTTTVQTLIVIGSKSVTYTGFNEYTGGTDGDYTYSSNIWNLKGINTNTPSDENDRRIGANSIRLTNKNDHIEMKFDKTGGVGVVSFLCGSYGTDSGGNLDVQYSTDGGNSWTSASVVVVPAWNGEWTSYSTAINIPGSVRIRIVKTDADGSSTRVNIDNFGMTDCMAPTLITTPTSLSLGNISTYNAITGTRLVRIVGSALSSNITVRSNNSAFKIRENNTGSYVASLILTPTNKSLDKYIQVQFDPTAPGATASGVALAITGTGISKSVDISGYGVAAISNEDFIATYDFSNTTAPYVAVINKTFDPVRFSYSDFTKGTGITGTTTQTADAFDYTGWTATYSDADKYYQLVITPKSGYLVTLTDMTFDVIMPSATGKYKVIVSGGTPGSNLSTVYTIENAATASIKISGSDFIKTVATTAAISGSTVTFTGIGYINTANAVTIKICAATADGRFGVDNVKINAIAIVDNKPYLTVNPLTLLPFSAGYVTTSIGTPELSDTQTITINGANLTAAITPAITGHNASYFSVINVPIGVIGAVSSTATITYTPNASSYGHHTAILTLTTVGGNSIVIQLDGYNVPGEYVFIGQSSTAPTSWADPLNWEHGFQPPVDVPGTKIKICAPLIGLGTYPKVICGTMTINTGTYTVSNGKIGGLTLQGTANLTVNTEVKFTGNGSSDDRIIIINDATFSPILKVMAGTMPKIIVRQATNTSGSLTGADNYHLISSPVGAISKGDIQHVEGFDGWFLDRFNETTNLWERFGTLGDGWSGTQNIEPKRGYSANYHKSKDVVMKGTMTNGDATFTTTCTADKGVGLNLLGNPYTGAISLKDMGSWTNFTSNYDGTIYLWQVTGNYSSVTTGTADANDIIPMCQGFWVVQKTTTSSSFTIPYSAVGTSNNPLYKSAVDEYDFVKLHVMGDQYADKLMLFEIPSCTVGYEDGYDATKWEGSEDAPQMYAMEGVKRFSTNSKSDISETMIGFEAGSAMTYTVTAEYNVGSRGLYLIDNKNRYIHNFENGSYTFHALKDDNSSRFKLVVGKAPIGVDSTLTNTSINVWSFGKDIYISGVDGEAFIYDISGRVVTNVNISGGQKVVNIEKPGVYIVRLNDISQKVIVK